jgi:hypothetical protein
VQPTRQRGREAERSSNTRTALLSSERRTRQKVRRHIESLAQSFGVCEAFDGEHT